MAKKKTTVYLDEELLRGARVMAARKGTSDSEIFEAALRQFLGTELLDRVWSRSELTEEEAMRTALEEISQYRAGN